MYNTGRGRNFCLQKVPDSIGRIGIFFLMITRLLKQTMYRKVVSPNQIIQSEHSSARFIEASYANTRL